MLTLTRRLLGKRFCLGLVFALATVRIAAAADPTPSASAEAPKGQRVYSIGHSFHMFMPSLLAQVAKSAGINDHKQVGYSGIGGSNVIQHWNVPEDKMKSKATLESGELDVLTMAPIFLPDEGIENFVKLASEKSPHIKVLVQEFWLPFDSTINFKKEKVPAPNREVYDGAKIKADHEKYFHDMDEHVRMLNEKYKGKPQVYVAPVGQAVVALREKIAAGEAPGLAKQTDLFTDAIGHVKQPVQILATYVYFGQIYGRSPVGLPVPPSLTGIGDAETTAKLNTLLQELAWNAVTQHPLSGVKAK